MIDLPFFELCNQAPAFSSTLSAIATAEDGSNRFMYYLTSSLFYRYDTVADTWQQLTSPVVAPVTAVSLRYTALRGYHGRVIKATSSTVTIPGLRGPQFNGQQIKILQGAGQGQTRTLTYVSETIHDTGLITATAATFLQDNLKKWIPNQWAGYTVGITFGANATQYKKILYNDVNTLYIADGNLQPHDPWNNQPFAANTPFALPVITAGAQAHFVIMSSSYTLDAPWTVTPDNTSFFTLMTGGLYCVSSLAAAPFFSFQYYDIAHDSWQQKTTPQLLIPAALGTDFTIERTGRVGTPFVTKLGAITSSNRTLNDAGLSLAYDRYANHRIFITGGTGIGQNRRIVGHTNTLFTVNRNWDTNPDATSTYEVYVDSDRVYLAGNGASAMYAYSPENDYWMQGQAFDDGMATNITATLQGWVPFSVNTSARIAAGITAINPIPTAGGTLYSIGDILTCAVGGGGAQVIVTSIAPGGIVTDLQLLNSGTVTGYTVGTGKAVTGGTGTLCTIEVTAVGATANIATVINNFLRPGNIVTFAGCTDALWNTAHTILGVSGVTTFSVAVTAVANMTATATQSTTKLVDPSKNWIVNEHAGRLVHLMSNSLLPTTQVRWIVSNTATTLTVATWVAATTGAKYVIYDSKIFGIDDQRKETGMQAYGYATSGSTTTLADTTKNWIPNQWAGYMFKVETGAGYGSGRISITSNTNNTLTYATQAFTPTTGTKYEIADSWGLMTAGAIASVTETTTKNWAVNQWAGKRVRVTGGTSVGQEATITSNTLNTLALTLVAPDATSTYAILGIPVRGSGIELTHIWGATDANKKGKFLYSPRGSGSNTLDIYDITTGRWTFGIFLSPQNEGFTIGSSYCYDGKDTIYLSRSVANLPIRIFALNINTNQIVGAATTTILQGVVTIGNSMEIIADPSNTLDYIYCLQNTGTLLTRSLIF